jgi:polyisoprenoid-binding protein YceI
MRLGLIGVAATAIALSTVAASGADKYAVDKPHTIVSFSVDRMGLTKMLGRFGQVDGEFTLDQANPATSQVTLTIDTASVATGFEARDRHLRSPDFFNAQEFPQMKFVSTKVERTGDKTAKVTGDLTMLGVTKPVTLDVTYNGTMTNPSNNKTFSGFSARGTLKRSEFGMKYLPNAIGDEVALQVELLGEKK